MKRSGGWVIQKAAGQPSCLSQGNEISLSKRHGHAMFGAAPFTTAKTRSSPVRASSDERVKRCSTHTQGNHVQLQPGCRPATCKNTDGTGELRSELNTLGTERTIPRAVTCAGVRKLSPKKVRQRPPETEESRAVKGEDGKIIAQWEKEARRSLARQGGFS